MMVFPVNMNITVRFAISLVTVPTSAEKGERTITGGMTVMMTE